MHLWLLLLLHWRLNETEPESESKGRRLLGMLMLLFHVILALRQIRRHTEYPKISLRPPLLLLLQLLSKDALLELLELVLQELLACRLGQLTETLLRLRGHCRDHLRKYLCLVRRRQRGRWRWRLWRRRRWRRRR